MAVKTPTIFVSYAWEDDVKDWVREFATRLRRQGGIDVQIDQWHVAPGDVLPAFMETAVRTNDFTLIVCTPKYKTKSDARQGGVGYEGHIITGEIYQKGNHRKFIPVLLKGEWSAAAPSFLEGKFYLDLRGDPYSEAAYEHLLRVLHGQVEKPPTIGPVPAFGRGAPVTGGASAATKIDRSSARELTAVPKKRGTPAQVASRKRPMNPSLMRILAVAVVGAGLLTIAALVAAPTLFISRPSTRAELLGQPERGWIEAYGAAIDSGNVDRILGLHVLPAPRFFGARDLDASQLRKLYQGWFDGDGRTRRTGFDGCSLANIASDGSRALRCDTYVDPPFANNKSRVPVCLVFTKDGKLLSRTEVSQIPDCPPR